MSSFEERISYKIPSEDKLKSFHGARVFGSQPARSNRASPGVSNVPDQHLMTLMASLSPEESVLVKQLVALQQRHCPGDYEKWTVLDERDKILYKLREIGSKLVSHLERCEQMCTEKERYMRIVQKRASPYECDENGEVSPEMMIKEYARSAADQERPLPHELRSENMMHYMMDYLLHNVLDKLPVHSEQRASWYDFLWSRTRAVRKEVTQLSLSDASALSLVERCTRLHILCGYVLCTLEVEQFDQKMNNENLGKCLQTLRHLYEDAERKGVNCPHEAEFRAYDVVLHMNDPNVLSQVLSYRKEVRRSRDVCLALQLCTSFQNNNYCRFFRLLKTEASFLMCCVSHKLFDEIRMRAISVMASSYGRNASYPLERLYRNFAFDSVQDAQDTLAAWGMRSADSDSDQVVLNRDYLTFEHVPLCKYAWIDAKNSVNFSQVVYGPLKTFHFFSSRCDVSNSFDRHDCYAKDDVLRSVFGGQLPVGVGDKVEMLRRPTASITPLLLNGVSNNETQNAARIENEKRIRLQREKEEEERKKAMLVQKLMMDLVDSVSRSVIEEERKKEMLVRKQRRMLKREMKEREERERQAQEKRRQEEAAMERTARRMAERLEIQAIESIRAEIIQECLGLERRKREARLSEKIGDKMWSKTICKGVDTYVRRMCAEQVHCRHNVKEGLEKLRERVEQRWLRQFWDRWREVAVARREAKTRRQDMFRNFTSLWHSKDAERMSACKYLPNPTEDVRRRRQLLDEVDFVKVSSFQKRRQMRIARVVVAQWRQYAQRRNCARKFVNLLANDVSYMKKYIGGEKNLRTSFKFMSPQNITVSCTISKRKRNATCEIFIENQENIEKRSRIPSYLHDEQSSMLKSSCSEADLTLARCQLDQFGWTPASSTDRAKKPASPLAPLVDSDEEKQLVSEARNRIEASNRLEEEAAKLAEEVELFAAEMRRMKYEFESRRI